MPARGIAWTSVRVTDATAGSLSLPSAPLLKMRAVTATATPSAAPVTTTLHLPTLPILNSPREDAVFLLHTATEVEHALMAQYLFAATHSDTRRSPAARRASRHSSTAGEAVSSRLRVRRWATSCPSRICCDSSGGPLNFEREDFPFVATCTRSTSRSRGLQGVARHVHRRRDASHGRPPPPEIHEIVKLATGSAQMPINRGGGLYVALYESPRRVRRLDLLRRWSHDRSIAAVSAAAS